MQQIVCCVLFVIPITNFRFEIQVTSVTVIGARSQTPHCADVLRDSLFTTAYRRHNEEDYKAGPMRHAHHVDGRRILRCFGIDKSLGGSVS